MNTILEAIELRKTFKTTKAVDGVSFSVEKGEILCVLGPNGAGKSTSIAMLSTLLVPDGGRVLYLGREINRQRSDYLGSLGIVPQDLAIYPDISARRNVAFFAALYGLKGRARAAAVERALEFTGLADRADEISSTFSGGMKRRLNIACAISHSPSILVMDEPTVGIDPQSRNHILESVKALRDRGTTVIYTSHYMEEVEEIADRILVIDHGKLIAEGTTQSLKETIDNVVRYRIDVGPEGDALSPGLYKIPGVTAVHASEAGVEIESVRGVDNLDSIIAFLGAEKRKIRALSTEEPSLEQVFLTLTGRTLRD